jgi:hypothetical protein
MELQPSAATAAADTHASSHTHDDGEQHISFTLPRADGGKDAWLVLASCFVLEATVWGTDGSRFPCCYCQGQVS